MPFTERAISTTAAFATSVFATDVDGDGDTDVLSASQLDDKIAWYENDGASPPSFTERVISTVADLATCVFSTDLDGDGDIDVLSASAGDDKIAWYEDGINCEGDANGDGTVDPLDSGYVLARFGCSVGTGDPSCDAADQNGDGAVDPLDSGFVLV